ncbi:MAG: DUF3572 domain-containing protein [Pseudomonadota bacterium]
MRQEDAETFALQVLAWLAGNEELLPVFLGSTGASADDLRARAADPEFLGSVLDFLMMDDAWIVAYCDAAGQDYQTPSAARSALPGGGSVHWT